VTRAYLFFLNLVIAFIIAFRWKKATVAPTPAKVDRVPAKKNPIGEASLALSAFPPTTTSFALVSTSPSSSVDSADADGDGEEVPLGDADADGVGVDRVDADGVGVDRVDAVGVGVGVDGVNVRFKLRVKL
jgi:hypothetical protein